MIRLKERGYGYDPNHRYYEADTTKEAVEFLMMWELGPQVKRHIDELTLFGIAVNPLEFDRYIIVDVI